MDAWWPLWMQAEFEPALGQTCSGRSRACGRSTTRRTTRRHLGSAYQDGWYGYASRTCGGCSARREKGTFSRVYCGGGVKAHVPCGAAPVAAGRPSATPREQHLQDDVCAAQGKQGDQVLRHDHVPPARRGDPAPDRVGEPARPSSRRSRCRDTADPQQCGDAVGGDPVALVRGPSRLRARGCRQADARRAGGLPGPPRRAVRAHAVGHRRGDPPQRAAAVVRPSLAAAGTRGGGAGEPPLLRRLVRTA